jgi:FAD/FMN-containing dehydrogenase
MKSTTALLLFTLLFGGTAPGLAAPAERVLINDVSRLNSTYVHAMVHVNGIEDLQAALADARKHQMKVSIAGKRHSMGGHAFYKDAVVLDMTSFNKVLAVDPAAKTITVQSGATWGEVIKAANEHGLAVEVMQAYAAFTIGGSMSVNVHESDPRFGPLIETVKSFHLLLADGSIVHVSRTENAEVFGLVIGGYGLLGIILDAELQLTEDHVYRKDEKVIDYNDYASLFQRAKSDPSVENIFARLSIVPNDSLLRQVVVTTYRDSQVSAARYRDLEPSRYVGLKQYLFGLSRRYGWGKRFRWYLQREHSNWFEPTLISRNNLMNADLSYLAYSSGKDTDILQEYFVPAERLPAFLDDLRKVIQEHQLNLLSATIRYVSRNDESVLSYSRTGASFGVVLYFNVGLSDEEQAAAARWTRTLIDRTVEKGGTYYLPYRPYATREQFLAAYPRAGYFYQKKMQYDPQEAFVNNFYTTYVRPLDRDFSGKPVLFPSLPFPANLGLRRGLDVHWELPEAEHSACRDRRAEAGLRLHGAPPRVGPGQRRAGPCQAGGL